MVVAARKCPSKMLSECWLKSLPGAAPIAAGVAITPQPEKYVVGPVASLSGKSSHPSPKKINISVVL
jgi:hypothetical protein